MLISWRAHTANHRWVICSALARINHFFPSPKLVSRIEVWLNEGIDLDPDGQYSEECRILLTHL